jgi:hypothetical protein
MTRTARFLLIAPAFLVAVSVGSAGAADKTKVDAATRRVQDGAKQIGSGQVGGGFKEMFAGIGHTIVEGAKFSGNTMGEFFSGKKSAASN